MSTPKTKRPAITGVTVYSRGKKFAYNVDLGPDPLTAKRRYEYKGGFASEEEAWAAAFKAKGAVDSGHRVAPAKRTIAEFMQEWLDAIRDSIKPSTHTNYID